jgi:hypothetical protein
MLASDHLTVDIPLPALRKPDGNTSIKGDAFNQAVDGVPVVRNDEPLTLSTYWCSRGSVVVTITAAGWSTVRRVVLLPNPKNHDLVGRIEYRGATGPLAPLHGRALVQFTKVCLDNNGHPKGGGGSSGFDFYIDPSGRVLTLQGAPVVGATVTLYKQDSATNIFGMTPNGSAIMSPSNRRNPDVTAIDGSFGWDVLTGRYKVRVMKQGCTSPQSKLVPFVETSALDIPPAVTGLDLRLDCPDKIKPKLSALTLKSRILSVKVSEAASVKALLQRCHKRSCHTVKTFAARANFSKVLAFTVPKSVKAGRYRVTVTAVDLAHNKAKPLVRTLSVR